MSKINSYFLFVIFYLFFSTSPIFAQQSCPNNMLCFTSPLYNSKIGTWYAAWDWTSLGSPTGQGWEAHTRYKPELGYYNSSDVKLIESHYQLLKKAGIDFIIIDATNGLNAAKVGENTAHWLEFLDQKQAIENPLQLAVAFGSCTWAPNIVDRLACQNNQAEIIFNQYTTHKSYYKYKNKPLLINFTHSNNESYEDDPYLNWDDERFFVGFATGHVSRFPNLSRKNTHGTWGWVADQLLTNPIVIHTIPGWSRKKWNDNLEPEIQRSNGDFLINQLLFAIKHNPDNIIIGAFNDYSEETFWEPSLCDPSIPLNTSQDCSGMDAKDSYGTTSPDWYYQIVTGYSALRYGLVEGTCYREENKLEVYCVHNRSLVYQYRDPMQKPVIIVPEKTFSKLQELNKNTSESIPGDLNGDGKVDIFDYQRLVSNFGNPYTIFDYQEIISNFGKQV